MPDETYFGTYLFIDGEYLRQSYRDAMVSMFDKDGDLDPEKIRYMTTARRAFFYDCLDEIQSGTETDDEFKARIAKQQGFFDEITQINGFHFRPGTVKGEKRKNRRQKEVDVQLATDMLQHGLSKNMTRAILLSGDLDFRPVVEVLVLHGVLVEVWHAQGSAAKELPMAADFGRVISFNEFYNMSRKSFLEANTIPSSWHGIPEPVGEIIKSGSVEGTPCRLLKTGDFVYTLYVQHGVFGQPLVVRHGEPAVIERYMRVQFKPITWS